MDIDRIRQAPRGGAGLDIPEAYPVEWYGAPDDTTATATFADLRAAGFTRPVDPIVIDADGVPVDVRVYVLRDARGEIAATWDEGRWWTPAESDAFIAAMGVQP